MMCHGPFKLMVVRAKMLEISGVAWSAADARRGHASKNGARITSVSDFIRTRRGKGTRRVPRSRESYFGLGTKALQIPDKFHLQLQVNFDPGLRLICRPSVGRPLRVHSLSQAERKGTLLLRETCPIFLVMLS